jgi:hypothetical protein
MPGSCGFGADHIKGCKALKRAYLSCVAVGAFSLLHHMRATYFTQLANYTTTIILLINIKETIQIRNKRALEFVIINAYFLAFFVPIVGLGIVLVLMLEI